MPIMLQRTVHDSSAYVQPATVLSLIIMYVRTPITSFLYDVHLDQRLVPAPGKLVWHRQHSSHPGVRLALLQWEGPLPGITPRRPFTTVSIRIRARGDPEEAMSGRISVAILVPIPTR